MKEVKLDLNNICFDKDDPKLNEEVRCFHGLLLPLKTSWSDNNPGRRFWSCPYYGSEKCKFFRWRDGVVDERSKFIIPKLVKKMKEMEEIIGYNDREIMEMEAQSVFTHLEEQCSVNEVIENAIEKLIEVKKKGSNYCSINIIFILASLLVLYVALWIKLAS